MAFPYCITVAWSDKDDCYIARASAFPLLAAHGETSDEARRELVIAGEAAIAMMTECGRPVPRPETDGEEAPDSIPPFPATGRRIVRRLKKFRSWRELRAATLRAMTPEDRVRLEHETAALLRRPTHREPTSAGEMLVEEFLQPLGITVEELADRTGIHVEELRGIIAGDAPVTRAVGERIARELGTSFEFWLNLQATYASCSPLAVVYERDGAGWLARAPFLDGCHTQGATLDEARARIREALALYIGESAATVELEEDVRE